MSRRSTYQFPWPRYPAIRLAVIFAAGIAVAELIPLGLTVWIVTSILSLLAYLFAEKLVTLKFRKSLYLFTLISYLGCLFFTGGFWYRLEIELQSLDKERISSIQLFAWENIRVTGTVLSVFETGSESPALDLLVHSTEINEGVWPEEYIIRLYSSIEDDLSANTVVGRVVEINVRIFDLTPPRNPHEFDYGAYLESLGIYVHGELTEVYSIKDGGTNLGWSRIRNLFHQNIEKQFDDEMSPLAKALLTGYKRELDHDELRSFSRSGLSHIMAVSGLHVGFLVAPFWLVIPFLWQWRSGKWIGLMFLSLLLLGYAGLTGFSASVMRASLMAWLLTTGRLFHKMRDSMNLMGLSAFILLLFNPVQLFEIGFQLSFAAVSVILLIMPVVQNGLPNRIRYGRFGPLVMIILVSFVVQLGLYPVLVYYFGEFSIIGPVANALVVPLLSATVPYSLLLTMIHDLWPEIMGWINLPNSIILKWIQWIAETLGGWDGSWIYGDKPDLWVFLLWISGIGYIAVWNLPALKWKYLAAFLLVINIIQIEETLKRLKPMTLEVVMLDVGQGDAAFIRTPNKKHILIDTGRWSPASNSGERILIPFLESRGIQKLDAVILSHPHADHIGGMISLMEHLQIDTIYSSGYRYNSVLYETYKEKAEKEKIPIIVVSKGDLLEIDPALRIFVVGPDGRYHSGNPNDHSVAVKVVYGDSTWLFTGDAEEDQEKRILSTYGDFLQSDFLKIGHHGSKTSSNNQFLNHVRPQKAAASLAFRNRFNHPHPDAIRRLKKVTQELYFTSLEGALVFESDGDRIRRVNRKDD